MRKHEIKRKKPEKTMFSVKRIFVISLIGIFLFGTLGVMASNDKVRNVKIVLSSGYEMDVVTTSTKVADILKENHIVILDGETVSPDLESDINDNKTITIVEGTIQEVAAEQFFSEEEIIQSYTSIVEKVVTVQEEIPFETITKDISNGSNATMDRVTRVGVNGLKEVTYRIKYQNGNEIEKVVISENIIREKVDKIVEVCTKAVSSRSSTGRVADYQNYAEERCAAYGWSSYDFDCLVSLWNKESRWNPSACNSSSGAYGIPQALPASKMSTAGTDYLTNYQTQINWGLSYIKGRYGSPSNAWAHSCRTGWY